MLQKFAIGIILLIIGIAVGWGVNQGDVTETTQTTWQDAQEDSRFGILKGYYAKVERSAFENTGECDVFVVPENTSEPADFLARWEEDMNLISIDSEGRAVINIDLEGIMENARERIMETSPENTIELIVTKPEQLGMGAPLCFSLIEIEGFR